MEVVRRQQTAFEHATFRRTAAHLDPQCGDRELRVICRARPIEDLPCRQIATTTETDSSRANTPQRKRNPRQTPPCKNTRILNLGFRTRLRLPSAGVAS